MRQNRKLAYSVNKGKYEKGLGQRHMKKLDMYYLDQETLLCFLYIEFKGINGKETWLYCHPVSYTHLTLPTTGSLCRSRWSPYH